MDSVDHGRARTRTLLNSKIFDSDIFEVPYNTEFRVFNFLRTAPSERTVLEQNFLLRFENVKMFFWIIVFWQVIL